MLTQFDQPVDSIVEYGNGECYLIQESDKDFHNNWCDICEARSLCSGADIPCIGKERTDGKDVYFIRQF